MTTTAKNVLEVERKGNKIRSHVRKIWLVETPEERVRQEYLCALVNEYGYTLEQIDEEVATPLSRGSAGARADFVIWRSARDRAEGNRAFIVVECKADNVTINQETYQQGANYAQYERTPFFVTHNNRETKYWKVDLERRAPNFSEISNIPRAEDSDEKVKELLSRLKEFKGDEFADLLHKCHNVIRNREHLDPAAAFDEIAKVLFVKVWVEREMRRKRQAQNLFTAAWLDTQLGDNPLNVLFRETREEYRKDQIFARGERINLKPSTGREIVRLLESYNLSDTSEDIKGIAFERFLGRTFRGEIGQFFTPRSIVEFMIRFVEPREGDVICDPASGSGGFLIRFFEIVREQILSAADREYREYRDSLEKQGVTEGRRAELARRKYEELQQELDPYREGSRLWRLANRCIYGTDANDRMARTSKMNMIMHGDGHGGVHHHNGFLNVNGIFDGRFDVVLTNPPFGANIESSDVIQDGDLQVEREAAARYEAEYGELYRGAQAALRAAKGKPLAGLFTLPKAGGSKTKTEILFIERCLSLLKPGGRLGIVLPEGIFNNPSLQYVREFCEDRAFIRAVVSLPQETFYSSGASVKASLLFAQKFTEAEQAEYDGARGAAVAEVTARHGEQLARLDAVEGRPNFKAADFLKGEGKPTAEGRREAARRAKEANAELKERKAATKRERRELEERIAREARALLKERFAYPVFLYEAERVGITATGEPDLNELYRDESQPGGNVPPGVELTCLELHREFRADPEKFFLPGGEGE
jgi:type I restriction enzyme M protein